MDRMAGRQQRRVGDIIDIYRTYFTSILLVSYYIHSGFCFYDTNFSIKWLFFDYNYPWPYISFSVIGDNSQPPSYHHYSYNYFSSFRAYHA